MRVGGTRLNLESFPSLVRYNMPDVFPFIQLLLGANFRSMKVGTHSYFLREKITFP